MQLFEQILSCYGWEGAALAGATLLMLGVQLYYYIFVYGRIPHLMGKNLLYIFQLFLICLDQKFIMHLQYQF